MAKYRFGKHPPQKDYRTLRLKNYLKATLAAPPAQVDTLARIYKNLNVSDPTKLFPIDAKQSDFDPGFDLAQLEADLKLVAG
jgi:hypothetical protein